MSNLYAGSSQTARNQNIPTNLLGQLFAVTDRLIAIFEVVRDEKGEIVDWITREVSPSIWRISPGQVEGMINRRASEIFDHRLDTLLEWQQAFQEANRTNQPVLLEQFSTVLSRFVRFSVTWLGGDFFAGIGEDITESKRIAVELESIQQNLQFTTSAAKIGIWDWDTKSDLIDANETFRNIWCLSPEGRLTFEAVNSRIHPDDLTMVDSIIKTAKETGKDFEMEFRIVWPDESVHWLVSRGQPVKDPGDELLHIAGVSIDITALRKLEIEREQLASQHRRQNLQLSHLIREAPIAIATFEGPQHRYTMANPAHLQLAEGKGRLVGRTLAEVWPETVNRLVPMFDRVFSTGEPVTGNEMPLLIERKGKVMVIYVTFSLTPSYDHKDQIDGVISLIIDDTERVVSRVQVELEQQRLEAIFKNAPIGILLVDHEGRIVRANPQAQTLLEKPIPYHQPFESQAVFNFFTKDNKPVAPRDLPLTRSVLDQETVANLELIIPNTNRNRVVLFSSAPVYNRQHEISGAVGVIQDITASKQAEAERVRSAGLIEVHHHLIQSREQERLQIAHHLHEGILQELIGLRYSIDEALNQNERAQRMRQMDEIKNVLERAIRELRDYSYELRPPALAPFGLEKAIRSHVEGQSVRYPGVEFHLDLLPDLQFLPESIRLTMFRVYQEVISNAVRHAEATEVWVHFTFNDRQTVLEVRDNGRGFNVPNDWVHSARSGRLGLSAAEERVDAAGGTLTINSHPGQGTTVRVVIPLAAASF